MLNLRPLRTTLLAGACCLLSVPAARARVRDAAGLFSAEAIKKAEAKIEEIHKQTGKELIVATVAKVPEDRAKGHDLNDPDRQREFFQAWARERMKSAGLDGVYVLICRDPAAVAVAVSSDEVGGLLTEQNRKQLRKEIANKFRWDVPGVVSLRGTIYRALGRDPAYDKGLLTAVEYVGWKYEYNRPVDNTNWAAGLWAIGIILGCWVLLGLVRIKLRKLNPGGAGVHDRDESGMSIGMLGGGIGAVTGQWLFDRPRHQSGDEAVAGQGQPLAGRVVVDDLPDSGGGQDPTEGTETGLAETASHHSPNDDLLEGP